MSDEATKSSRFDEHCRALGRLCIAWAVLDRKLTDFASVLVRGGPEVAACIWSGAENMKPRAEAIKKLLFVVKPPIDPEWIDQALKLVHHATVELGQQRNRYVHDEWFVNEDEIKRIQWGGRLEKPQSRKRQEFRYAKWHIGSTADVDDLTDKVEAAAHTLTLVAITVTDGLLLGRPPEPFWQ